MNDRGDAKKGTKERGSSVEIESLPPRKSLVLVHMTQYD